MLFSELNLKVWINKTLKNLKINELTEIQAKSLPLSLKKNSLIINSQTGSGKTLCYLIPILQNLDFSNKKIQALIVLPTKELVRQVYSKIIEFKKNCPELVAINLINSSDDNKKLLNKANVPQIVVSTPVKVLECLKNRTIDKNINYFVLDEADMLFDLGFTNNIDQIFKIINSYTLVKFACSATIHESFSNKLKKYLQNTKVISTSKSIWENKNITHNVVYSSDVSNPKLTLEKLLKTINPYFCIIFCNTKDEVNEVYRMLLNNKLNAIYLYKDLTTHERKRVFKDINNKKYQYLVATDLVSRGLDIAGADVVISYNMPKEDLWYIHRSGRTGRNNTNGTSYVVYNSAIDNQINRLQKKIIWNFLFINKNNELISKNLKLRIKTKRKFDSETNNKIKMIIANNSKKVTPGYKKRIKAQILKIKQQKKHEYLEKIIKQRLLRDNIRKSKRSKYDK